VASLKGIFMTTKIFLPLIFALSTPIASPILADAADTQVLEEYFSAVEKGDITLEVGSKIEESGFSEWRDIKITNGDDEEFTATWPWVRVDGHLLGGHTLTISDTAKMVIAPKDDDVIGTMNLTLKSKNFAAKVSGSAGDRTFDYTGDQMTVQTSPEDTIQMTMIVNDYSSTQKMEETETLRQHGNFSAANASIDYGFVVEGTTISSQSTVNAITGSFDVTTSSEGAAFDLNSNSSVGYAIGNAATKVTSNTPEGPFELDIKFGKSEAKISLQDKVAHMDSLATDVDYLVKVGAMGMIPLSVKIDEAVSDFTIPLENVEQAAPARLKLAMDGVEVSDAIWAMIDPIGGLPHEKANLDIDLDGSVIWNTKIDELGLSDLESMPVLLESIKINKFDIQAVGAAVAASGDLVLDNEKMPPVPYGDIEVSVKGGLTLIDKLGQIGLIQPQMAMMAKGMSGMFFQAGGDGPDHLISKLQFTQDGHISANGMPIK
jgi:hypothetical protein